MALLLSCQAWLFKSTSTFCFISPEFWKPLLHLTLGGWEFWTQWLFISHYQQRPLDSRISVIQQLKTEGHHYGDISLKLWKDFLTVQIMWKLDLSMQMDTCQHSKLLTKKIPHKISQRAAKYADVKGHCMHKVDNNTGSFILSFL